MKRLTIIYYIFPQGGTSLEITASDLEKTKKQEKLIMKLILKSEQSKIFLDFVTDVRNILLNKEVIPSRVSKTIYICDGEDLMKPEKERPTSDDIDRFLEISYEEVIDYMRENDLDDFVASPLKTWFNLNFYNLLFSHFDTGLDLNIYWEDEREGEIIIEEYNNKTLSILIEFF